MGIQRNSQGVTVTLSTTTFTSVLISGINSDTPGLPELDGSHLGSTSYRERIAGELQDSGDITLEIFFDPDDWNAIASDVGTEQTITIEWPTVAAQTSGATLAGTGWIDQLPAWNAATDELMTGQLRLKWKTGPTYTSGS